MKKRVAKLKASTGGQAANIRRYMTPKQATAEAMKKLAAPKAKNTEAPKKKKKVKKAANAPLGQIPVRHLSLK